MAGKRKRLVNLYITPTAFSSLFRRISGKKVEEYDFSGIGELRQLLSNERAKILHIVKAGNPESIYHLAKLAGRDFKSVSKDVKILEKFGFIRLVSEAKGTRKKLRPVIEIEELSVNISF